MSELAVKELQGNADHVISLESEVERLSGSVREQEVKVQTLQVVSCNSICMTDCTRRYSCH